MNVYRVTITTTQMVGHREWTRKRVIPAATRQRLGCILAYDREQARMYGDQYPFRKSEIKIERAPVGDFEDVTAEFTPPAHMHDNDGTVEGCPGLLPVPGETA